MSYQVLARKWRPKTFAELSGQGHVVQALSSALTRGRLHHAYLLTGTRGVGKTTIARILAKSLNCLTNGVSATPCGTCAACTDIDAGRFVDLLELDAASNTGIDNMREILDNARYAPTTGRYKVYLIDEVHMLSKAAFNSMLKTLEEPPEHVKFVLATTDPQKIPVTVLSRCLQFNLKQLPPTLIEERMAAITATEAIATEAGGLALIARAAHGSMRDALSLLDQAIAYGGGEVREPAVREMLGAVDTEHVYRIADALLAADGPALLAEVDALATRSTAFGSALEELASLFHRVATVQAVPAATAAMTDGERVASYAAAMTPELVQLAYQICVQGRADLDLAPDEATGFAMTLLRLLAFEPGGQAAPVAGSEGAGRREASPAPRPMAAAPPRASMSMPAAARADHAAPMAPRVAPAVAASAAPASAPAPIAARSAADATDTPSGPMRALPTEPEQWPAFVASLKISGVAGQLAAQTGLVRANAREVVLALPEAQRHLTDKAYVDKLVAALAEATGAKPRIVFELASSADHSLAAQDRRERADQKAKTEAAFRDEPFVRDVLARFSATIRPDSIKPDPGKAPT
jgi:DNA polymerase-3 subunit gamma/tau